MKKNAEFVIFIFIYMKMNANHVWKVFPNVLIVGLKNNPTKSCALIVTSDIILKMDSVFLVEIIAIIVMKKNALIVKNGISMMRKRKHVKNVLLNIVICAPNNNA